MIYIDIDIMINIDIHKLHYNTPNESYNFPVKFCSNSANSIVAGTPTTRSTRYGVFGDPLSAIIIHNSLRKLEFSLSDYRSFHSATYNDRSNMLLLSCFPWWHSSPLVFVVCVFMYGGCRFKCSCTIGCRNQIECADVFECMIFRTLTNNTLHPLWGLGYLVIVVCDEIGDPLLVYYKLIDSENQRTISFHGPVGASLTGRFPGCEV